MKLNTVVLGGDHAGFEYKKEIIDILLAQGYHIINHGTNTGDSVDYPDYIHPVAEDLLNGNAEKGIIICGSGNGVAMTANKYKHVRAAVCWTAELARLSRQHNDANVISIPARFVNLTQAKEMVQLFLSTEFEGGRHQRRVDKISSC